METSMSISGALASVDREANRNSAFLDRSPLIFGKSEKMKEIQKIIDQVANTDITVLIRGESGTGKELVAREICSRSQRKNKPFRSEERRVGKECRL